MSQETLNPTVASTWRLDVNTGTEAAPVWVQVRAVSSFQPAVNDTVQDASDYDSEGWGSDAITLKKWQNIATLQRKVDSTFAPDPGQEHLRLAARDRELVHCRFYERYSAEGEAYEGKSLVQWAPAGGDTTALNTVQVTMLGQGARTEIAHPGV
ncbi:hypothetical protein CLV30_12820 [Haloactinopolyspora alba]|uniref:Phage tail-like protein n=1 Tax=Haloactinopolyspora alba TaxID=648780 RepID=A0A2P8DEZ4_9ACTN|nr:hypothetical protein [Haloactinopolyspora alba]PSK95768.1 hypothetical protein CLV30_12820 [Haloactinopolyspora alba]